MQKEHSKLTVITDSVIYNSNVKFIPEILPYEVFT